jgi:hypothetical protein
MRMMQRSTNNFNDQLAALLGQETEIKMLDGEVLQGVPMEIAYPRIKSAHLMFEAAHGEYLCLDLDDIGSIRQFNLGSRTVSHLPAF